MTSNLVELGHGFKVYVDALDEARFIYGEIFEQNCYDIAPLPQDAFIIDAGANIGLFSIYMKQKYPASRILAFEPAPRTFDTLSKNLALHKTTGVDAHQCGLGPNAAEMTLTYYPNAPGNSTLVPGLKDEMQKVFTALGPDLAREFPQIEDAHSVVMNMYSGASTVPVPIQRLSHFLRDVPGLSTIDLLKIDVEGAELGVLGGLDDEHWAMVKNITMEYCEFGGELDEIEGLLRSRGFTVTRELLTNIPKELQHYMITARRDPA